MDKSIFTMDLLHVISSDNFDWLATSLSLSATLSNPSLAFYIAMDECEKRGEALASDIDRT